MSHTVRTPVERAALAVQRAIDRELPVLIPLERRGLWAALITHALQRLKEFDAQAEANRGITGGIHRAIKMCRCGKPVGLNGQRRVAVAGDQVEDFCSQECSEASAAPPPVEKPLDQAGGTA